MESNESKWEQIDSSTYCEYDNVPNEYKDKVLTCRNKDITFSYGLIEITSKVNVMEPVIINTGIRLGVVGKTNISGTKHWYELQLIYKNEEGKAELFKGDLDKYQVKIIYKGDMAVGI